MKQKVKVPFHWVTYGEEEKEAVLQAMRDNWFSPRGPKLAELGAKWAAFVGRKYGWPVSSGTGAIHLALLALGIGPGDKVAVPSYTCSPTVYPVTYTGATPVFVDCEMETYGMDPASLDRALTAERCKAVIPVHLYGSSCKWDVIRVAREHKCLIVEDACESDGATYRDGPIAGQRLGAAGDMACFSMRGDKLFTAMGTGGITVMDDPEQFRRFKLYSDLGLRNDSTMARYRDLEVVGYNYEISNPAAAFGIAQVDRLPEMITARQTVAGYWRDALSAYAWPAVSQMDPYDGHVWYQYPVRFETLVDYHELDKLGQRLLDRGVPFIPPFWPMHMQPAYAALREQSWCPTAEYCSGHVFLFPCYPSLSREQVRAMAAVIMEEYGELVMEEGARG